MSAMAPICADSVVARANETGQPQQQAPSAAALSSHQRQMNTPAPSAKSAAPTTSAGAMTNLGDKPGSGSTTPGQPRPRAASSSDRADSAGGAAEDKQQLIATSESYASRKAKLLTKRRERSVLTASKHPINHECKLLISF